MLSLCQPRSARRRARSVRPWRKRSRSRAGPKRGRTARLCAGSAELLLVDRASRVQADMPTSRPALARVSSATLATLAPRAPASTRPASPAIQPLSRNGRLKVVRRDFGCGQSFASLWAGVTGIAPRRTSGFSGVTSNARSSAAFERAASAEALARRME